MIQIEIFMSNSLICRRDLDLASDLGTGTPSSLMDSDTEDITEEDDYFLSSESTE